MRTRYAGLALSVFMILFAANVFLPNVVAAYTYLEDVTYNEINFMDAKRLGWDLRTGDGTLVFEVEHQTNIPNNNRHNFVGNINLDTDQDDMTGDHIGTDYRLYYVYNGDGSVAISQLYEFDDGLGDFDYIGPLEPPAGTAGGDKVVVGLYLTDIGSPSAMNIYYSGGGHSDDYVQTKYTYDTSSEERSITVDGDSSTSWSGDMEDITDTSGDVTPGWADVTKIYTTDDSSQLYMRYDFNAPPLDAHPEISSSIEQSSNIYFDTDQDSMTGDSVGTIGADYMFQLYARTYPTFKGYNGFLYEWTGTDFMEMSTEHQIALDDCLEFSILLSDIGVSGSTFDIYVDMFSTTNDDQIPNIGKFSVPPKPLSDASTEILPAAQEVLYFVRTGNMFDDSSLGFVYSTCTNRPQHIIVQTDSTKVNQDTGAPLFEGSMVLFGGPIASKTVERYGNLGFALITYQGNATHHNFMRGGTVIYSVEKSTYDYNSEDYFVIQIYEAEGRTILSLWGIAQTGTYASGVYFSDVIEPNISSYDKSYYIGKWTDANGDGIQQSSEMTVVKSGS